MAGSADPASGIDGSGEFMSSVVYLNLHIRKTSQRASLLKQKLKKIIFKWEGKCTSINSYRMLKIL